MRSIYLTVIVILTSAALTAQIREVPIIGNPVLQKKHHEEFAELGISEIPQNVQYKVDCPDFNKDITYLLPGDSLVIELDLSNKQEYELVDSATALGTVKIDTSGEIVVFYAGNIAGAERGEIAFIKTIDGQDSSDFVFPLIVKRINRSYVMSTEFLMPGENIAGCAEPISNLPGTIQCNNILNCAENYGGNDLQVYFFETGATDENCFNYRSSRFPGTDTLCVVLCDEFTVCDTFKQPYVIVGDTLNLPFFEDFSGGEIRPNADRWLEDLTFVNQTMPYNPPSLGAATFDGLDASGQPYGGEYGTGDRLTSKPIDLSKENVNSGLVLSFYYQLKGRGFLPRIQDSLIVDFWTSNSEWKQVVAIPGSRWINLDSFPAFEYQAIALDDPSYFHNGFQFRFKNLSERTGAFGVWHVDYVYMKEDRDTSNRAFRDIAFSDPPPSALNSYTAMPIKHLAGFEDAEIRKELNLKFFNHFNSPSNPVATSGFFSENITGIQSSTFTLTNATNYPSQELFEVQRIIPDVNVDPFINDLKNRTITEEKLELKLNYSLNLNQDTSAFQNDTCETVTIVDNYFAYDDGTAERALEVNGQGTQFAVEFEANVEDYIGAIKIHFPYTNSDFTQQQFILKIWANGATLDDEPTYKSFHRPSQPNFLQAFATFELVDAITGEFSPLLINPGKFYVGLENFTSVTPAFAVGYDKNNPDAAENLWSFSGSNQVWKKYTDVISFRGAPMVRPIMTQLELASTNAIPKIENQVTLFPNPAKEVINFKAKGDKNDAFRLEIFNTLGQLNYRDILVSQLDISAYQPGMYFAKITNLKTGYVQNLQFFKEK